MSDLVDPDQTHIGMFQTGAPSTSRRGAIDAYPKSGTHRRTILDAVASAGERGLTDEEICAAVAMGYSHTGPRRRELVDLGLVYDTGRTRTAATGSAQTVWRYDERGMSGKTARDWMMGTTRETG